MSSSARVPRLAARIVVSTLVCSMALGIVACSGKPENSPVIRKKFAEMDAVQTEVAEATKTLKAIAGDMTVLKDQMSEIRALSPDPSGTIQAVKRLEEIERRLAAIDGAAVSTAAMASAPVTPTAATTTTTAAAPAAAGTTTTTVAAGNPIAPAPDAPAALVAKAAETEARPSSQDSLKNFAPSAAAKTAAAPAAKETAKADPKPAAVSTSAKKPAEAKATKPAAKASSAPRGKYYKVQSGDTLEKIAKENNTTVDSIRSANKLPNGARPLLGQQLFIPQS